MTRERANKWLSFQMALLIFFNSIAVAFVYLDYELRKDFIATVLCINKDKPKLQCNGKCYLKKELKKAQEQKSDDKAETPQKYGLELFYSSTFSFDWETSYRAKTISFPVFNTNYLSSSSSDIFHPPQVCV